MAEKDRIAGASSKPSAMAVPKAHQSRKTTHDRIRSFMPIPSFRLSESSRPTQPPDDQPLLAKGKRAKTAARFRSRLFVAPVPPLNPEIGNMKSETPRRPLAKLIDASKAESSGHSGT